MNSLLQHANHAPRRDAEAEFLLTTVCQFLSEQPRHVLHMLEAVGDISLRSGLLGAEPDEETRIFLRQCIELGLLRRVAESISIEDYETYADGGVSPLVARVVLAVNLVVKHGGSELRQQLDRMSGSLAAGGYSSLLPKIHATQEVQVKGAGDLALTVCAMEFLNSPSIQQRLLTDAFDSTRTPTALVAAVIDRISRVYERFATARDPNLNDYCYGERISSGLRELERITLPKAERDLLTSLLVEPLLIDDVAFPSLPSMLGEIAQYLPIVRAPFAACVHGDLNIGNVLVADSFEAESVMLLDPSPAHEFDNSDWVFDLGKLLFSVTGGLELIRDRQPRDRETHAPLEVTTRVHREGVEVDTRPSAESRLAGLQRELDVALRAHCARLGGCWDDSFAAARLDLANASAFLGSAWRMGSFDRMCFAIARGMTALRKFADQVRT